MIDFAAKVAAEVERCGAPLCVGLDPIAQRIPPFFGPPNEVSTVARFCEAVLARLPGKCAAVKPQIGFFEAYGPQGYALAAELCRQARDLGLPVLLDAKRGDIGSTAEGYAAACLTAAGFNADCVTVNPYMGVDTLEPFFALAEATSKGVAVLVRTSNPGAADFQGLDVGGAPLWAHVAEALRPAEERLMGAGPWSNLMVVVGATAPAEAARVRDILPRALFLVPGFGAQGASAKEALAGLPGGKGGLVNASRSILYPQGAYETSGYEAWCALIDEALAHATAQLGKDG